MDGLTIRAATEADRDRIAAIIDDPPAAQAVAIAGDERRALAAGRLFVRHDLSIQLAHTVVAEIGGETVAIMHAGRGSQDPNPSPLQMLRLLVPALRAVGPDGLWRFLRSRPAWARVSFEPPAGDYFISELDVAAAHRNRGIGAALLRYAEAEARRLGCARISLTTNITNPAQHLYERSGFRIVDTKRDAGYERWGGSPGRVFMVRALEADGSLAGSETREAITQALALARSHAAIERLARVVRGEDRRQQAREIPRSEPIFRGGDLTACPPAVLVDEVALLFEQAGVRGDVYGGEADDEIALAQIERDVLVVEQMTPRPHARAERRLDARFFAELTDRRRFGRLACLDAAAGRNPERALGAQVGPEEQHPVFGIDEDDAGGGPQDRRRHSERA